MVGSQTALKAIWASLLKQPPDVAHIIKGAEGMALSEGYQRCSIPYATIGTWTTKIAKLPVSPGAGTHWCIPRLRSTPSSGDDFLLLAQSEEEAPGDSPPIPRQEKPSPPAPLLDRLALGRGHGDRGDRAAPVLGGRRLPLQTPMGSGLREDLSDAVASGRVALPEEKGRGRWIGTLKRAKRSSKRRNHRNVGAWRRFSLDGPDVPLLRARRLGPPVRLRSAPLLQEGDGGGARRPQGNAVPPRHPGGRLGAGAAGGRRQPRRAHHRLLHSVVPRRAGTSQVLCYQRTLAAGEVVGVGTNNAKGDGP